MARIYLNDNWSFYEDAANPNEAVEVRIPHTTREVPYNYFDEREYQMLCLYRKNIYADRAWQGKTILITFDGIAHSAEVSLNGKKLAEHHCGYTAFTVDLTDGLRFGEDNLLEIKVDSRENQNVPPFGFVIDYMTFGGIYRDVYLEVRNKEHIADAFLVSKDVDVLAGKAVLESQISLSVDDFTDGKYELSQKLDGEEIVHAAVSNKAFTVVSDLMDADLWDVDSPTLYHVTTELIKDGQVIDSTDTRFGFRKIDFKADGFYLNDRKVKLRGLNRHQSYPYVGYAMPESMQRYDADILKNELGCNAVRTSHYPQSHYFIDRCDELGLLVFMEFPGWQYIGDAEWKEQAVTNVREMVEQYRNHPSIFLWGVRINESGDDDEFYKKTNAVAHELDSSRPTGGVRCFKKSHLFEDVYTYNDFLHNGRTPGCEPKAKVTSDMSKGYLISEYNGHMYPTKAFDWEEHRVEHMLRHANVLEAVAGQEDIAGSFGWCMFDYNTHKDFGSGDRICYHGVMDMFRNPKLASLIYACQADKDDILELSSSMDIGEHPGCNRGFTYIITNADSVKMYKNDIFIKEYRSEDSAYKNLKHGPIVIDDFIGDQLHKNENFKKKQADIIKTGLNYTATHGYDYPLKIKLSLLKCIIKYHMKPEDAVTLYNKYIGDWGGTSTVYRFDAYKNGKKVKSIIKKPMTMMHYETRVSSNKLIEKNTYDVAEVRVRAVDENGNQMYFYNEPLKLTTEGPIEIIGSDLVSFKGGMTGIYVRTSGEAGAAKLVIENGQLGRQVVEFNVEIADV